MKHFLHYATAIFLLGILLVSCNGTTTEPDRSEPDKNTFTYDVEYADATVFVDSAGVSEYLVSFDEETQTYVFRANIPTLSDIKPGKQLLVFRKGLGEIVTVNTSGNSVTATTKPTTLDKVFKNAMISWDRTIRFNKELVPQVVDRKGMSHIMTPVTADSFDLELEMGEYTYKISWKMLGDDANVYIHVEKKIYEALRARYSLVGKINKFSTSSTITMQNSQLTQYQVSNPDVRGTVTMSVNCAGSGNDAVNLELPITLIKVPITVGPLIVMMNIKVQVVVSSIVPPDGSSLIDAKFEYESSTGFSFAGGQIKGLGAVGTYTMEKGNNAQTGASSAVAANFGLGFPRLEFSLFDNTILVPWVQTAMLLGGDYSSGINPCQQAKAQFIGAAGADFSAFGVTLKKNVTLWSVEKVLLKAGVCP